MNRIKKYLSIILITAVLFLQVSPAMAFDIPQPPSAPAAPTAPQAPSEPTAPPPPPPPPPPPIAPQAPTLQEIVSTTPTSADNTSDANQPSTNANTTTQSTNSTNSQQTTNSNGTNDSGNVGDTTIDSGNSTTTGIISTLGNNNVANNGADLSGTGASVGVINSGNGTSSTNNGSATISSSNNTLQNNSAGVGNSLNQESTTGQNTSNKNVGNTTINTGDANTTGTIITGVNTNVAGVLVSEFNVADDHIGDIILDFGAGCVSGCNQPGSVSAVNSGNGSNSNNNAGVSDISNSNTFQNNDASVESNLILASDSGNNSASKNTGGDSKITTGDANVAADVLTFVNNNLSGNVVFGVVNIFGNLVGDIILPDSALLCSTCGLNATAQNTGNGANSTNNTQADQNSTNNTFQTNDATIENNLVLGATTGGNETSKNTGGNSLISTGDTTVMAQVLNVANSNIIGGNWWLVVVNEAGHWIGRILGADGNFAGSSGTEFTVGPNGEINVTNSGNGSGSNNNSSVSQTTNNTTVQNNDAKIVNNLNLSANTGGNTASKNTGGNSSITTGDAKIVANIVNFVNNNIIGNGRLFVTVVNVFGSWIGDFITPGTHKENNNAGIGGVPAANNPSVSSNLPQGNSSAQGGGNSSSSGSSSNYIPFVGGVIAGLTVGRNILAISTGSLQNSDDAQILGVNNTLKDGKTDKVSINLAWAVLVLPILGVGLILKRKASLFLGRTIK